MKVYLLYVSVPYEGGWVYGVYSTKEKAEQYASDERVFTSGEEIQIKEVTLDEFADITI